LKYDFYTLIIGLAMFILELIKYVDSLIERWMKNRKKDKE